MLAGSVVALVTPMHRSGEVDWAALDRLIDWHVESGTHGIVPVGTTGESATLSVEEHIKVVERTVVRVGKQIPVIAGTGANSTSEAIELTRASAAVGADACLLVTPYYNRPTQEGLYQHYKAIAAAIDVPQVLYNVPARTGCDMKAETVGRLSAIDNIIGIKEACGDVERVTQIRACCPPGFVILSGEDAQTLDMLRRGAVGTISVTANVLPHEMAQFVSAYIDGDEPAAKEIDARLQPIHQILFVESSPQPTKWALHLMGKIDTGIRLPLLPMSQAHRPELERRLRAVGAIA
jgi:4-hydroxy-tetrahydrodipicolinate synthase